jgi:ribulose-phosphate 3-epimerase
MRKYKLSASLVCADPLSIGEEVKRLVAGGIDALHFDVMDGMYVPRLGLYPELLKAIRSVTDLPIDVHMMSEEPVRYVADFARAGATFISVHSEASKHLHYALKTIRENGVKAGVALNYATPLCALDYVMDDIDMVMLMAINPGIVGHKLIPGAMKKIVDLRKKIDASGRDIIIAIDGGVSQESAAKMVKAGANYLVCGTSSIFKAGKPLEKTIKEFRSLIDSQI